MLFHILRNGSPLHLGHKFMASWGGTYMIKCIITIGVYMVSSPIWVSSFNHFSAQYPKRYENY